MAIPATRSHQAAGVVPTLSLLRRNREVILQMAAAHNASNVRVLGSVARGEAAAGSDVDFVVDVAPTVRGFAFFGSLHRLASDLSEFLGLPVDVISVGAGRSRAQGILHEAVPL